MTDGTDAIVSE